MAYSFSLATVLVFVFSEMVFRVAPGSFAPFGGISVVAMVTVNLWQKVGKGSLRKQMANILSCFSSTWACQRGSNPDNGDKVPSTIRKIPFGMMWAPLVADAMQLLAAIFGRPSHANILVTQISQSTPVRSCFELVNYVTQVNTSVFFFSYSSHIL